ncbi:MAG: hypothetical protein ACI9QA_000828 [Methanobacteriota archaeon]
MNKAHPLPDEPRYVLLLDSPTEVYRDRLGGSTRQRVDSRLAGFLTEATPESGLTDEDKFPYPLRQLKDRGGKVRGLGVWCATEEFDLFFVMALYDKDDERKYYDAITEFIKDGKEYKEKFENMSLDTLEKKVEEWSQNDGLMVFTEADMDG